MQLKEVRREVELSRKRSIRLKAQVDKLQESREGLGWSQHRERVKLQDAAHACSVLQDYDDLLQLISVPGHGGSAVHFAAAEPPDRVRVRPA